MALRDEMNVNVGWGIMPAHYGNRHHDRLLYDGKLTLCDQLAADVSKSHRKWQSLESAPDGFLDGLFFKLSDLLGANSAANAVGAKITYVDAVKKYNETCLQAPGMYDDVVETVQTEPSEFSMVDALDSLWTSAKIVTVQGARYASEHPWRAAGAACVGVGLVLAPELAPLLLVP